MKVRNALGKTEAGKIKVHIYFKALIGRRDDQGFTNMLLTSAIYLSLATQLVYTFLPVYLFTTYLWSGYRDARREALCRCLSDISIDLIGE